MILKIKNGLFRIVVLLFLSAECQVRFFLHDARSGKMVIIFESVKGIQKCVQGIGLL